MKKTIYISAPVIDTPEYWLAFEKAEAEIAQAGFIPVNPSLLYNLELTEEQFMRIRLALISSADAAYFVGNWFDRPDTMQERRYCEATGKTCNSRLNTLMWELK